MCVCVCVCMCVCVCGQEYELYNILHDTATSFHQFAMLYFPMSDMFLDLTSRFLHVIDLSVICAQSLSPIFSLINGQWV